MIGQRHQPRAYLAGPEVFLENAIELGIKKKSICKKHGIVGLFPFDNEISADLPGVEVAQLIYRANINMMKEADTIIVNLTPFRGPSADVGSVFELGLMVGLKKPVFGYSNVSADFLSRVESAGLKGKSGLDGRPRDINGMYIENFGNVDNLMIDACFAEQGWSIVLHESTKAAVYDDLDGFERCVEMAAKELSSNMRLRRAM